MKEIISDKSYLSDIMDELPSKVLLNKGVTGCGGTYLELHCKRDSLVLVPTIELARNKQEENFLIVYGDTTPKQISNYVTSKVRHKKIIGTYDSLKKIMNIFPEIINYFLLVDEYHILFNSYSFRNEAIKFILNNYNKFSNYCFMTATPLNDDIILEQIKHLPRLNIAWNKSVPIKLNLVNVGFTSKELLKQISADENVNYHIFLNSIKTIKDVVSKLDSKNYRVICSDASRKANKTLNVKSTLDKVMKYNFYTAAAFEGCDIYDPIGKTIVLCDTNIATTILDISTLIRQIAGRLRDSIYKDEITMILNTKKHRYVGLTRDMFMLQVSNNIELGKYTEHKFKTDPDALYKKKELAFYNDEACHSYYVNRFEDQIFYDDNLRKMDVYNYDVVNGIYKTSISVIKEANKCGFETKLCLPSKNTIKYNWVVEKLEDREYTFSELKELFLEEFKNRNIVFKNTSIKDFFPEHEKVRKTKNKIKDTYYKFKL